MKTSMKHLVLAALMGALTFLGSFLAIPVGPVPITLQTLFVLLAGLLLPPKEAALAMVVHLVLKLFGGGGPAIWMTPSFGFVLAFIVAALVLSVFRKKNAGFGNLLVWALIGSVILYAIGIPYMAYFLNGIMGKQYTFMKILEMGMLLFIPGDILKSVLAAWLAKRLMPAYRKYFG